MKTVELNGNSYDARTGALISKSNQKASPKKPVINPTLGQGTAIDGVSRRKPRNPQPILNRTNTTSRPGNTAVTTPFIKPEKAKTLLRSVVSKPSGLLVVSKSPAKTAQAGSKKDLLSKIPQNRLDKAATMTKSQQVSRFAANSKTSDVKLTDRLVVADEPVQKQFLPIPPLLSKKLTKPKNVNKTEVFEHRIASAVNHLAKPYPKERLYKRVATKLKVHPKYITVGAACLAIFLLGGFLAYQKVPAVAMRVAASKAGFSGRLPANIPSGFSFKGPIYANKGSIALKYQSNTDSRQFTIVQKPTNWTSEALLSNFLLANKSQYQTYHDRGLTVYIYNENDATWVNKGVWYNLGGHGALSSDQILSIAGSM